MEHTIWQIDPSWIGSGFGFSSSALACCTLVVSNLHDLLIEFNALNPLSAVGILDI